MPSIGRPKPPELPTEATYFVLESGNHAIRIDEEQLAEIPGGVSPWSHRQGTCRVTFEPGDVIPRSVHPNVEAFWRSNWHRCVVLTEDLEPVRSDEQEPTPEERAAEQARRIVRKDAAETFEDVAYEDLRAAARGVDGIDGRTGRDELVSAFSSRGFSPEDVMDAARAGGDA